MLIKDSSTIVRDKLVGHSDEVLSLDYLKPGGNNPSGNYLSSPQFRSDGLLLSASADKTLAIWDLRINKRVMSLTDKNAVDSDIVKGKFIRD